MINLNKNDKTTLAKIKTLPVYLLLSLFFVVTDSCNTKRVIYTRRGYDITKPETVKLGTKLDEISGICWVNDTLMLANNDESSRVYLRVHYASDVIAGFAVGFAWLLLASWVMDLLEKRYLTRKELASNN